MSKRKGFIILTVFILSWLTLFWVTGSRVPWQILSNSSKDNISNYLGDIQVENYDRMGFTKGLVKYVPNSDSWAVGTERGEVFLFDNTGKNIWKRALGIGKIFSIRVSKSNDIIYVGEQSPTGNLYALNATNGDILWQKAASDYVGSDSSARSYPMIVHIVVDDEDNVFALTYRFIFEKDGSRRYNGKVVAYTKKGDQLWVYPKNENMDTWTNWCDVTSAGNTVAVSTSAYEIKPNMKYTDTMYFLNKKDGTLKNSVYLKPIVPFETVVMRGSPTYSSDGKYLAGSTSEGRGFLFDPQGKVFWERNLGAPVDVNGSWINAAARDGYVFDKKVIFSTINTFNRENWQLPTPVEHPGDNSVFAFDLDGKFLYKYRALGTVEGLAYGKDVLTCAIGRNVRTQNFKAHGAMVIDFNTGKELDFYQTEGPLQAVAISADGKTVAGIEAPAITNDGKVLGAYRFHLWKRDDK